jgi:protocatechuate 3,4-dioxygenase beta subunit
VLAEDAAPAPARARVLGAAALGTPAGGRFASVAAVACATPLVEAPAEDDDWTLRGVVRDDFGRPLPGARVRLGARQAFTDGWGMFELAGLAPPDALGNVAVVATADWHVAQRRGLTESARGGDALTRTLNFALERGATLAGQVVDAEGRPVAGARVYGSNQVFVDPLPGVPCGAQEQCSGWNGRFLFECVQGGEWTVTAEAIGLVGCKVHAVVAPGEVTECAALVMQPEASLCGRVLDLRGLPVAGAEVRFQAPDADAPAAAPGVSAILPGADPTELIVNVPYPRASDAEGNFRVTGLAPGRWRLAAMPPPGVLGPTPGLVSVDVAVGEAVAQDVRLTEPRRLEGVVVDESGLPVPDLEVNAAELAPLDWRRIAPTARTDGRGRFVLDVAPDAQVELTADWQARGLAASGRVGPDDAGPVRLQLVRTAFYGDCIRLPLEGRRCN